MLDQHVLLIKMLMDGTVSIFMKEHESFDSLLSRVFVSAAHNGKIYILTTSIKGERVY